MENIPFKIKNLTDYFRYVRERPGMYLGQRTISKLNDHLQGYMMAYWHNDIDNPTDKYFFDNFTPYVCSYYEVITNAGWKDVILEQCFDREDLALDTFFELYDLFISRTPISPSRKQLITLFDKIIVADSDLISKLGNNYKRIVSETMELFKEALFSNLKYDYDLLLQQLEEKAEELPELILILKEIENNLKRDDCTAGNSA